MPQAPKLKLAKPAGFTPPPPPAAAGIPTPPPASSSASPAPAASPAAATQRPLIPANRTVGKAAAAFDVLALVASLVGAVLLFLELFVKSKG